jgi:hypothetical protein
MLTLLFVSWLAAQSSDPARVDFAGRWQLVSPAPSETVPSQLFVDGPSATQIIATQRHFADGVRVRNYSTDPTQLGQLPQAKWVGATLVFPERGNGGRGAAPPTPDREEVWSLDENGLLHIDITERMPRAQPTSTHAVYRRVPVRPWKSGENLLENPTADRGAADWIANFDATVEPCGPSPCFVVRNQGRFSQTVMLPSDAAGKFLVVMSAGATERINPDGAITGLPSLYGTFSRPDRILGYLQGADTLGRPQARDQWVTLSGVFPVPEGATRLGVEIKLAAARGTPHNGSAGRFDDLGAYLFASEEEARAFVATRRDSRQSVSLGSARAAGQQAPPVPAPARPTPPVDPNVARDVHVSLSIRGGKTTFRSGEPIRLVLSFTATQPGYTVNDLVGRETRLPDEIAITPETGVVRWFERYGGFTPDFALARGLSTQPVDLTVPLNYQFRFDQAGEYTVRVRTRRASAVGMRGAGGATALETNAVTFRIVPMTAEEEAAEVERLRALIDVSQRCDTPAESEHCDDLAFLAGDIATREKVRRVLSPPTRNLAGWSAFAMGLFISRNPQLAVSLLEESLRDLTRPASHITTLARLRLWVEGATFPPTGFGSQQTATPETMRLAEIQRGYVDEVLASLPRRSGTARRDAALNLLSLHPRRTPSGPGSQPSPIPPALRQVIIEDFSSIDPVNQAALLQTRWPDIRDPALLAAVVELAASRDSWIRAQALGPLLELAPGRAREVFIAEMLNPASRAGDVLLKLPDQTIPQIEQPLLAQVARMSLPRDSLRYRTGVALLARYATGAIVADMERLYADWQRSPADRAIGAALKAYLDRWRVTPQ